VEERIAVGLPEGLDVVHHGSHVEIVLKWFSWKIVAMTAFAILWDAFLVNWYVNLAPRAQDPMVFYFPLIHVAVGIGISYYVIAGWLNRTRVLVGNGRVTVRHSPMPWFGNADIEASSLKQLYTQERIRRSRNGPGYTTYEVRAVTQNGRNTKLIGGLETSEQAMSIEQEVEKRLSIRDVPVAGEMRDYWS
jgi:hypothetical protein